jgi:RNA polymerase sigma-70 factor (ECF subfamily)
MRTYDWWGEKGPCRLEKASIEQAEEWIARSARGDHLAFAEIVHQHQSMVFSMAYHFLRDRSIAEELAQEVFFHLHQNLDSIKSSAHLTFWLRKVTSHRCIDQSRRRKVRPQVSLDDVPEPASFSPPADPMLSQTLERMVTALPEKARMVVLLRYQEDLEPAEIAELLDMPVNTVKSHLRRSLAILRDKLTRCLGEAQV